MGGFTAAFLGFAVAATVIVVLMFLLALSVTLAHEHTVAAMRNAAPTVKRWGGWVLVLVGAWLVLLGALADLFAGLFSV